MTLHQGQLDALERAKVPTPVKIKNFQKVLEGYDNNKVDYLINGLTFGFRLEIDEEAVFHAIDTPPPKYNHESANKNKEAIQAKIQKELDSGRLEGPFTTIPYDNYQVSAIAAAEKKQPGEYRLIQDLSWPKGASGNDTIDVEKGKCKYQKLDHVIDTLLKLGKFTKMSIFDIEHAYKIIPVHPDDVPKMGFYFNGYFYFDRTLAMGCRTSAKIFESFSTALEWVLKQKFSLKNLHHILDDFILLTKPAELTEKQREIFMKVCKYLGIPLKMIKLQSGYIVIYLGVELDSIKMEARLPQDKLDKCKDKIQSILAKSTVRRGELESVAGLLNFACKVVRPGRAFLRRIYNIIATSKSKFHFVHVNHKLKGDLTTWLTFLQSFNGTVLFPESVWQTPDVLQCYTDSAPKGWGLVFGKKWSYGPFLGEWSKKNICLLELYPIVLILELFGRDLQNKRVIFWTDNEALSTIINNQTSKDKEIMVLVRKLVLLGLKYNVMFRSKWLPTYDNIYADPLSRQQVDLFQQRAQRDGLILEESPAPIPRNLLPENFKLE